MLSGTAPKSFIYMYRFDGRARMMTLGDYPRLSLAEANIEHSKASSVLSHGADPGSARVDKNQHEREAETVKQLAEEYIKKWAKPRKRTAHRDELILEKDILPHWKSRKAKDIKRKDVILLLDRIVERGAPISANRTLALIRVMYNFAISRDIVEYNPCTGIKAPAKPQQRNRVLSEEEIKIFLDRLPEASMHKATKIALQLILATGQRPGEVTSTKWQDIDLNSRWWTIPNETAKNNLQHRVYLSDVALELLQMTKIYSGESEYVFPSPRGDGKRSIEAHALSKAMKRNEEIFNFKESVWPHDLRRTAASHMTSMGIPRLVVKKILNHAESDVTAVYDRHSYDNEKCNALDRWSVRLEEIIS